MLHKPVNGTCYITVQLLLEGHIGTQPCFYYRPLGAWSAVAGNAAGEGKLPEHPFSEAAVARGGVLPLCPGSDRGSEPTPWIALEPGAEVPGTRAGIIRGVGMSHAPSAWGLAPRQAVGVFPQAQRGDVQGQLSVIKLLTVLPNHVAVSRPRSLFPILLVSPKSSRVGQ